MSLMVSISGIRGVIGESLTPEIAVKYAAAFAEYCKAQSGKKPSIVVGRDGRITGEMLSDIICGTLSAAGADVRSLGICPTPTVQLAVEKGHASGGISVTASHNPMQWNGMKFVARTGMFLDAMENRQLWSLAEMRRTYGDWQTIGDLTSDPTWIQKHIQSVLSLRYLDAGVIQQKKFKIVLDCINAAGGLIVPALLDAFDCAVIPMNCDVSGVFEHTPEPIPENLVSVAARVKAEGADLGIAVDPDVDRLVLITEEGTPYGEEYTVTSAVKFVLEKNKDLPADQRRVVVNLSTTRAVEDVAQLYGSEVLRTPVGEINVAKQMKEVGAIVGGEGSGGVIVPTIHLGRDAIVGIGLILQLLAESGGSLSQLKASLPQYSIAKGKIEIGGTSPDTILASIASAQAGGEAAVNTEDGVKLDFPDYWVHLRKSNTEPIVRIIAEAPTMERAAAIVEEFKAEIASSNG
jgi:phosphomannomutase